MAATLPASAAAAGAPAAAGVGHGRTIALGVGFCALLCVGGLFAPKGTPEPIIAKLNAEIARILATPDMQARFQDAGYAMLGGPPQRLHDIMVDGIDRFGAIIKSVGIEPE